MCGEHPREEDLRSVEIEDAALQAALQPRFSMQCFQLSPGRRVARMDSLGLSGAQIVRETQYAAVQKLGATPADLCTVSQCTPDPAFRFTDRCAGAEDAIFFMPENTEFDLRVPAGARTFYVGFSQQAFQHAACALDPERWEDAPRALTALPAALPELRQAVDLWLESAEADDGDHPDPRVLDRLVFQSVVQAVVVAARQGTASPPPPTRARALRICQSARAFVEERMEGDDLPTLADICAAVGVCERTLQYAFREYVGISPLAYLRLCRLSRARAMLLAATPEETSVTQVAMRLGFLHLGRFAGDYKQMFEETPSATLTS
ncbi:helix-turn-helix transcriptional regulator [Ancylobacter sp. MQZ15Z-1]|uniref:Helix-turn-helix transcriptional regulator n=1 Tax=Ancylobacter mangrovi TaxID=2972472 RepID=A0A9X2T6Z4_9HYPH|nr:helix-turn-helix transcriptional regulator [Ancylobacter mangrovi]MCS0496959.1 helix-turn-helix transcriptional regulator [Ancylobacter mangrovi]